MLIGEWPITVSIIQIICAVLQENADRFSRGFANQRFAGMATANVGEATDMADDFAEDVRFFPGRRESTNAARADAANSSVAWIIGKFVGFGDFR